MGSEMCIRDRDYTVAYWVYWQEQDNGNGRVLFHTNLDDAIGAVEPGTTNFGVDHPNGFFDSGANIATDKWQFIVITGQGVSNTDSHTLAADKWDMMQVDVHCNDDTYHLGTCSGTLEACKQACTDSCHYISHYGTGGNRYSSCTLTPHLGRTVYQRTPPTSGWGLSTVYIGDDNNAPVLVDVPGEN